MVQECVDIQTKYSLTLIIPGTTAATDGFHMLALVLMVNLAVIKVMVTTVFLLVMLIMLTLLIITMVVTTAIVPTLACLSGLFGLKVVYPSTKIKVNLF